MLQLFGVHALHLRDWSVLAHSSGENLVWPCNLRHSQHTLTSLVALHAVQILCANTRSHNVAGNSCCDFLAPHRPQARTPFDMQLAHLKAPGRSAVKLLRFRSSLPYQALHFVHRTIFPCSLKFFMQALQCASCLFSHSFGENSAFGFNDKHGPLHHRCGACFSSMAFQSIFSQRNFRNSKKGPSGSPCANTSLSNSRKISKSSFLFPRVLAI